MKLFSNIAAAAGLSAALLAGSASAMPINGSITLADSLTAPFSVLTTKIVGGLNSANFTGGPGPSVGFGVVTGASGSYTGSFLAPVTTEDLQFVPIVQLFGGPTWVANGFVFNVFGSSSAPVDGAFNCSGNTCNDSLSIALFGSVSKAGFTTTAWSGTLGLTGACTGNRVGSVGNATACGATGVLAQKSGSWSIQIQSDGTPPVVTPEPVSISMLGLGLLAAGAIARRKRVAA